MVSSCSRTVRHPTTEQLRRCRPGASSALPNDVVAAKLWPMQSAPTRNTVLVVDDDDDVRETISDALFTLGYKVVLAHDGKEALEVLSRLDDVEALCVVLADVHMPRLDGPGLARAIRRDPKLRHVRILVISSSPEYGEGVADETIAKPFELAALRDSVARLCAGSRPQPRLPS